MPDKDEPLTPEEIAAAAAVEEEGKEDEGKDKEPTLEELKERNAELERRLNRQRTAKAREARAAKRAGDAPAPKDDDDAATATAAALAEKDKQIADLEAKHNRAQALSVAAELGFHKPASAVKLVEWGDLDDPSDPDEVRAALREVAKENPEMKKAKGPKGDGGEGAGQESGARTSFNDIIRRAAGRA